MRKVIGKGSGCFETRKLTSLNGAASGGLYRKWEIFAVLQNTNRDESQQAFGIKTLSLDKSSCTANFLGRESDRAVGSDLISAEDAET